MNDETSGKAGRFYFGKEGKAGISVKDIVSGGLKGALSLAMAGEFELPDAAEIASTRRVF